MANVLGYDGGLTCSVPVSDMKKSIAWYRDVLGFELLYEMAEMGWCEMASPVAHVTVGLNQVETVNPKGGPTLVWGVADIDAARQKLEAQKVRFDGETMTIEGMVRLATFYDIDGHKIMLSQTLAKK